MNKITEQLGMSYGKANAILKKQIMLAMLHGKKFSPNCYRCGKLIEKQEDLSVDHKKLWRGIAATLFWDLDNVAFSHLDCNSHERHWRYRKFQSDDTSWCSACKQFLPIAEFYKSKRRWNGLYDICRTCVSQSRLVPPEKRKRIKSVQCACGSKDLVKNRSKCVKCWRASQKIKMALRRERA